MVQKLLYLTWIDVLTASYDHILDAACDAEISVLVHNAKVT